MGDGARVTELCFRNHPDDVDWGGVRLEPVRILIIFQMKDKEDLDLRL